MCSTMPMIDRFRPRLAEVTTVLGHKFRITGMIMVVRDEITGVGLTGTTMIVREEIIKIVVGAIVGGRENDMVVIIRIIMVEEKNVADMNKIMVENTKESGVDTKVQGGHLVCFNS